MSKFNEEKRDQIIKELMISVRKNTQDSKCIDVFEILLNEIPDKEYVDTVIIDTLEFIGDFSRLCKDVDKMENLDFISRIVSREFIRPSRFFGSSKRIAGMYLALYDILCKKYDHPVYNVEKKISLPNTNCLGDIYHKDEFTPKDIVNITRKFGDLSNLSVDEVKEKLELSRKIVLLYNYLPAIVKAFIQTKRRSFNLDRNSTKFE